MDFPKPAGKYISQIILGIAKLLNTYIEIFFNIIYKYIIESNILLKFSEHSWYYSKKLFA